ncbi:MAG: hypothetical protein V3V18_15305 [Methylococcales bacterium]
MSNYQAHLASFWKWRSISALARALEYLHSSVYEYLQTNGSYHPSISPATFSNTLTKEWNMYGN